MKTNLSFECSKSVATIFTGRKVLLKEFSILYNSISFENNTDSTSSYSREGLKHRMSYLTVFQTKYKQQNQDSSRNIEGNGLNTPERTYNNC